MDRREEEQNLPATLLASSASLFSAGEHLERTNVFQWRIIELEPELTATYLFVAFHIVCR